MSHVTTSSVHSPKVQLGFWIYLMTDCILFATLFATYAVLRNNTAGGPSASEIFDMPYVLVETLLLLTSSFTAGIALLAAKKSLVKVARNLLIATLLLGLGFLAMELYEFIKMYNEGHSWRESAFLSSYFTLVATHGLHITAGVLWLLFLLPKFFRAKIDTLTANRLTLFSMFWHFLDVVWIFIFTVVYLIGDKIL